MLRSYQENAIQKVFSIWKNHDPGEEKGELGGDLSAVCLVSPTGSGKTRMGADIIRRLAKAGKRILWVAHRTELISQAAETIEAIAGVKVFKIDSPAAPPFGQIFVGSIQTLLANGARPEIDLLIVDECHHIVADEWLKLAQYYSKARVLGMSATPTRLDEKPLGVFFGSKVDAVHYSELLKSGHLVDCVVFSPSETISNGLAADPVEAYKKHSPGQSGFVFVGTKKEASVVADRFSEAGIPATTITDSTPKKQRAQRIEDLKNGKIKLLVNVFALTEGVDIPSASVAILGRNCGHISMFLQIVGRVLRPFEGKKRAVILDLVGAMRVHGFPTEDRFWDLNTGKVDKGEVARYGVECPTCFAYFMRSQICPYCDHKFETDPDGTASKDRAIYNEVLQCVTTPANARKMLVSEEDKAAQFSKAIKAYGLMRAAEKYRAHYNEIPKNGWIEDFQKIKELQDQVIAEAKANRNAWHLVRRWRDVFGESPDFSLVDHTELKNVTINKMRKISGGQLTPRDRAMIRTIFNEK